MNTAKREAREVIREEPIMRTRILELLADGTWSGSGVRGPESFDPRPFLDLLRDGYGEKWVVQERTPSS